MLESAIIFFLFLGAFASTFHFATELVPVFIGCAALLLIARYITRTIIEL